MEGKHFLYIDFEFRLFKTQEVKPSSVSSTMCNVLSECFLLISTVHGTLAGPKNLHSYKPVGAKQVKN